MLANNRFGDIESQPCAPAGVILGVAAWGKGIEQFRKVLFVYADARVVIEALTNRPEAS